jgi:GR25 family glycosyltransferase involved in LPS biosynthesis
VREDRMDNVKNICKVLGNTRVYPKVCNFKNKIDRDFFLNNFPKFADSLYAKDAYMPMNPLRRNGEIGCWLSHISAWTYMINNNIDHMIILEDDIALNNNIFDKINKATRNAMNFELDLAFFGEGSGLYFITNNGAKELINKAERGFQMFPLDLYMFMLVGKGKINGQVGPIYTLQDQKSYGSHLEFELEN